MSVLIAAGATTAEVLVANGGSVSLVLVATTDQGIPDGASATISWKGAAGRNTEMHRLTSRFPGFGISGGGTYVVTKGPGAYTVERS